MRKYLDGAGLVSLLLGAAVSMTGIVTPWIGFACFFLAGGVVMYDLLQMPCVRRRLNRNSRLAILISAVLLAVVILYRPMRGYVESKTRPELSTSLVRESAQDGASRALMEAGQPEFTFHPTYNPATHEIVLTLVNEGKRVARLVDENQWVEVGNLSFKPRMDRPKPDITFTPFYSTKNGISAISGFIPSGDFLGGLRNLGDIAPRVPVVNRWIDRTPELFAALKADRSSVLRYMATLEYNYGTNASQRGVYSFCFEVRLFTVGEQVKSNDRILFPCE